MKVEFKRQFGFLQHTGTMQVFPCGVMEDAPLELLNDAGFLFQKEHGMVVVFDEPKAEPEIKAPVEVIDCNFADVENIEIDKDVIDIKTAKAKKVKK